MIFSDHTHFFDVSAVDSVKQKLFDKESDKACHESVIMLCLLFTVLLVIVAIPGRTHLLLKLTFSRTFSHDVQCHLHEF